MYYIRQKHTIIDSSTLVQQMKEAHAPEKLVPNAPPSELSELLRTAHQEAATRIKDRFFTNGNGAANVRETSYMSDTIIISLARYFTVHMPEAEAISIIAVGGYGRYELSPHSDIDILFLCPPDQQAVAQSLAGFILHMLWDLKMTVGHAFRTTEETITLAGSDHTIHTALLDARLICGNPLLYNTMIQQFETIIVAGSAARFITEKLAERNARHQQHGDMRYTLEPHLKEGKGGQRDLQTLWWIARNSYGLKSTKELSRENILTPREYRTYSMARSFFWKTRAYMHYFTGRADERLTFDLQREISKAAGYTNSPGMLGVERFMKRYFLTAKHVGDLTRVLCTALEAENETRGAFYFPEFLRRIRKLDGFPLEGRRLTLPNESLLEEDPVTFLRIFHTAQRNEVDIHPEALKQISRNLRLITPTLRRNPEANRLFVDILTSPKAPALTLRRMNDAGVLGRFITDFGKVVGLMQFDMYHVLTVDEHTLHAIDILHNIELGKYTEDMPLASGVIHEIEMRRALYVALFLHDIAKGRGGDHSLRGASIAHKLCPRLGLSTVETEIVAWLVEFHLLYTATAFKRDLADPHTIQQFIQEVHSLERLKLLLLLSVADMRAVSPKVWSSWKAVLLRELYNAAAERMGGGGDRENRDDRVSATRNTVAQLIKDWPESEREPYLQTPHGSFWLGLSIEQHAKVAELVHRTQQDDYPFNVQFQHNDKKDMTELWLCVLSQHALFSQVAGACAATRVSIISAKIFTLPLGLTVILLDVQSPEGLAINHPDKQERLVDTIRASIGQNAKEIRADTQKQEQYTKQSKAFSIAPYVVIDNSASQDYTVIEVMARDRLGLLYTITNTLAKANLQVATSHISTYGEKAVDVFYVRDLLGMKLLDEQKTARLRNRLLRALEKDDLLIKDNTL